MGKSLIRDPNGLMSVSYVWDKKQSDSWLYSVYERHGVNMCKEGVGISIWGGGVVYLGCRTMRLKLME